MIASVLICSLPLLALGRVEESRDLRTLAHLQTMQKKTAPATSATTSSSGTAGVCPGADTIPASAVFNGDAACGSGSAAAGQSSGVLYNSASITDAAVCASTITVVCPFVTPSATLAISYSSENGGACAWFGTCSTANLQQPTSAISFPGVTGTFSTFTTIPVASTTTNTLVDDTNAMGVGARLSMASGLAQGDTTTALSQSPEQIQAEQQGESASTVASLGTSVGQDQQSCPGDYSSSMARGEWQCVKRPAVGAMVLIASAGGTVFVLTLCLTCGIGHKLRNKGKDDGEAETMGGEFEEEGEEEEEEEE